MSRDLSVVAWPVHTERLVVRLAHSDDVEATWQIRRIPSVSQWLTSATENRAEYMEKFLDPQRLS